MTRILIVEDDAAIGVRSQDDLRLEGYEVDVALDGDGYESHARAKSGAFDLIVLDVMLPTKGWPRRVPRTSAGGR